MCDPSRFLILIVIIEGSPTFITYHYLLQMQRLALLSRRWAQKKHFITVHESYIYFSHCQPAIYSQSDFVRRYIGKLGILFS